MVFRYPETRSQNIIFRDLFINSTYVADNNGSTSGVVTIDNGATAIAINSAISYPVFYLPDEFSISFWYTPSSFGSAKGIIGQWESSKTEWGIFSDSSGNLRIITSADGGAGDNEDTGYTLTNGTRVHIGFAVKNSTKAWELFINGVSQGTTTASSTFLTSFASVLTVLSLGAVIYTDGKVEQVRIHKGLLTTDEFLDIYQEDTFTEIDDAKAIVALPLQTHFNDGTNEVTRNIGTGVNVILGDGSTAATQPTQLLPHGMNFDGTGQYLNTGSDTIGTGDITITWVMNPATIGETNGRVFDNRKFVVYLSPPGRIGATSNYSNFIYSDNNNFVFGRKSFHAITRTSTGVMNFYTNGILSGTANQDSGSPTAGTSNVLIGDNSASNRAFDGNIYTPRIFHSILTPTQIRELSDKDRRLFNN